MKVKDVIEQSGLELVNMGDNVDDEVGSVFCCDLLSVAMGKAPAGGAWITVMGNVNTLAVAALTETALIVLAEGSDLDDAAVAKASQQGITVLKSEKPVYETAKDIDILINA
ncbi:MAG: hypothetical protein IJD02_00700 [Lachnospiraceae bacterium]|nr:hypothetical protein [Lachnospiraceae bacterium]